MKFEDWYNASEWREGDNAVLVADDAWEHQAERIKKLETEKERRGNLLEDVVNEVAYTEKHFYTPNAAGNYVYLEPEPAEMVRKALEVDQEHIKELENMLVTLRSIIELADEDVFGSVKYNADSQEHFVRDEAIHRISKLLEPSNE